MCVETTSSFLELIIIAWSIPEERSTSSSDSQQAHSELEQHSHKSEYPPPLHCNIPALSSEISIFQKEKHYKGCQHSCLVLPGTRGSFLPGDK